MSVSSLYDSGNELGEWNALAYSNHITMKACLKDKAVDGIPVRGERFQVKTIFGSSNVRTDLEGCFTFSDQISFNFLSQEKYYSYPVSIEGLSNYKGRVSRLLAINPWQRNSEVIKDMEYIDSIQISDQSLREAGYSSQSRTRERNFRVDQINVFLKSTTLDPKAQTETLHYEFSMKPSLLRLNLEGEEQAMEVSRGQVDIKFTLLEKPAGQEQYRMITEGSDRYRFKDGNLSGQLDLVLAKNNFVDSDSLLKLVMTITPHRAPLNLGSEYAMTYMKSLSTNTKLDVQRVDQIESHLSNLLTSSPQSTSENEPQGDSENEDEVVAEDLEDDFTNLEDNEFGYMVAKVDISRGSVVSDNYNQGTKKQVRALTKVCLVDPRSDNKARPITHKDFLVSFNGEDQGKTHKTGADGCLDAALVVDYDKYDCEHFKKIKLKLTGLEGVYQDIFKERLLAINPWAKNSPFGLDVKRQGMPEDMNCQAPRINVPNVAYSNEGNVIDSYRLNNYLHLSFKKDFDFNFKLYTERFHSYSEEQSIEPLTQGEYVASFVLLTPKAKYVDYNELELSDFEVFSAVEKEIKVDASGQVKTTVKFPFTVTDSYLLSYKNLLLIKVRSKDPASKLKPITVSAPFFGVGQGAKLPTQNSDMERLSEANLKLVDNIINSGHKLLSFKEDKFNSGLNLYRAHFLSQGKKLNKDADVHLVNYQELYKLPLNGGDWIDRIQDPTVKKDFQKRYLEKITPLEFKMLTTKNGRMPKTTLKKLCRFFFRIPDFRVERNMGQRNLTLGKNSEFEKCLENPVEHLQTTALSHIVKVIPSRMRKDGKVVGKKWATLIKQEKGKVYRGDAFFAAQGNRYFKSWGERSSSYKTASVNLNPSIPYLLGFSAGGAYEMSKYNGHDEGIMHMDYDRYFTQRTKLDLSFDSITLRFKAQVSNCVSIVSPKTTKVRIHLCEEEDQYLPAIEESWYFIGRTNMRANGVLSDGNAKAFDGEYQLIRGRFNYDQVWDKFKGEDVLMVIGQMGPADLSNSFQEVLEDRPHAIPFENRSDNSFPGLIVP